MKRRLFLASSLMFAASKAMGNPMSIIIPSDIENRFSEFVKKMKIIYQRELEGDAELGESNLHIYDLITSDMEAAIIFAVFRKHDNDYLTRETSIGSEISTKLYSEYLTANFDWFQYYQKIGSSIRFSLSSQNFARQIISIEQEFRRVGVGAATLESYVNDAYQTVDWFERPSPFLRNLAIISFNIMLGYSSPLIEEKIAILHYWPEPSHYNYSNMFLNMYRGDPEGKSANLNFLNEVKDLPYSELMSVYSWIYYGNYDIYIVNGISPNEMPPWIAEKSPLLRSIHTEVNTAVEELLAKYEELNFA